MFKSMKNEYRKEKDDISVCNITWCGTIEKETIIFTANGKRHFVPRDQDFPLYFSIVYYLSYI